MHDWLTFWQLTISCLCCLSRQLQRKKIYTDSRLSSGLVSYQRPSHVSSTQSRSRSGRRFRESSINERRTMHDLEMSVKNVSDLVSILSNLVSSLTRGKIKVSTSSFRKSFGRHSFDPIFSQ